MRGWHGPVLRSERQECLNEIVERSLIVLPAIGSHRNNFASTIGVSALLVSSSAALLRRARTNVSCQSCYEELPLACASSDPV